MIKYGPKKLQNVLHACSEKVFTVKGLRTELNVCV